MNEFPQMLYRAGGPEQIHGGNFSTLIVNDEAERKAALADGWHESTPAAVKAQEAAKAAALTSTAGSTGANDNDPPTRAELEQKATELGIEFSPNIGDKKLAERIAEKLAKG